VSRSRLKPQKKINELLLLITIYEYVKENGFSPSAGSLMEMKSQFAPSLMRIDTLRMWLKRKTNRTIRRVNKWRPYRYELNRQGKKRIVFLVKRALRKATLLMQLDPFYAYRVYPNIFQLYLIAKELAESFKERRLLFNLFMQYLRA
jgi:hypothetical protein